MKKPDANEHQRKILSKRLQKLELFSLLATNLANDIKAQLDILTPLDEDSDKLSL